VTCAAPPVSTALAPPPHVTLTPPPGVVKMTRVALLLPLSGPQAALGAALLDAAQLALFDFADRRFALIPHDTKGRSDGARAAAEQAIAGGARLILGPLLAGSVAAVAPVARAAGVNVVAFSNDRTVAGAGVFIMGFVPRDQIERVVGFAVVRQHRRFAALLPADAYGETVARDLRRALGDRGAELVAIEFTDATGDALAAQIRRFAHYDARRGALKARLAELEDRTDALALRLRQSLSERETLGPPPFDAVLLPQGDARLRELAPLLAYYDVDPAQVRFLGTSQWARTELGAEPSLVGAWYSAPPPAARARFESRFIEVYGHAPARIASLAYDATALAALLARNARDEPDYDSAALASPSGFAGTDGIFRFGADGVAERGLAIIEIEARGARVISAAPDSFAGTN
ncbi:MAG: penicillin-binding protein activator, partial [Alphaproteobacteria bacterium]